MTVSSVCVFKASKGLFSIVIATKQKGLDPLGKNLTGGSDDGSQISRTSLELTWNSNF